jgi:ribulose-phosphate 3-epimerase
MAKDKIIIPAIIAKTQEEFDKNINKVKDHFEIFQLDFMDGDFVPNNSLDFDLKLPEGLKYEAHLMVKNPEKWIEKFIDTIEIFLIHFESTDKIKEIIDLTKDKGKKVGIVINPETEVAQIEKYLDDIDQVLVMSVNPGFYGSKFLPETLNKAKQIRELKPDLDIEVDGGITPDTINIADQSGVNMFVSGSYIVKSDDIAAAIENLKKKIIQ